MEKIKPFAEMTSPLYMKNGCPANMANIPANTYINKGLTPNDSKKILHRLQPFISIIHIRSARKRDANPHVARTKVGDHIFLLIGHP